MDDSRLTVMEDGHSWPSARWQARRLNCFGYSPFWRYAERFLQTSLARTQQGEREFVDAFVIIDDA